MGAHSPLREAPAFELQVETVGVEIIVAQDTRGPDDADALEAKGRKVELALAHAAQYARAVRQVQ